MAVTEISVQDLAALGEGTRVIDVREPDEWAAQHIPWAEHVPLESVPLRLDRFGSGPTYVICRSGGRSGRACEFVADQGLEAVNVRGGMLAWADAGYATVSGA